MRTPLRVAWFEEAVRAMPPPGSKAGFNPSLPRVARKGWHAGMTAAEVEAAILRDAPKGSRKVTENEVRKAVASVFGHAGARMPRPRPPPPAFDACDYFASLPLKDEPEFNLEEQLRLASPVILDWEAARDAEECVRRFFMPADMVVTGQVDKRRCDPMPAFCLAALARAGYAPPFVCPNPFTGKAELTADGSHASRTADAALSARRYALVEFDELTIPTQLAFWLREIGAGRVKPAAVIHSGGKSAHGWFPVGSLSKDEWEHAVKGRLFGEVLTPLGVCHGGVTAAQLSRMPGTRQAGRGQQRFLYLAKARAW